MGMRDNATVLGGAVQSVFVAASTSRRALKALCSYSRSAHALRRAFVPVLVLSTFLYLALFIHECLCQGTASVQSVCSSGSSGCTQRLFIDLKISNQNKLQFQWEAGDINKRTARQSDAGNAGLVIAVQKTAVSYAYGLTYVKAVPFNWIEYAHRASLWQVKDGGATFCAETWGSKCQDEHGEDGFPVSPNTGLPVDGAQGKCCWCPSVWHLWLNNPKRGREPMLKCNFWGLRFGKIPDPYLTKFCPVVQYPWYRMLQVSDTRTWFFKVHVGISWWRPPSPSALSDEEYKRKCESKIASGEYPKNFDCSQRLHTDAGMADVILELSDTTKVARDASFDVTARLIGSDVALDDEPNVKGKYVFVPTAPSTNAWVQESLITEGCSDSDNLTHWNVTEAENPDLARLCKSGSPFCNLKSCLKHLIVLDKEQVSVDGSTCDRPGVSLQQWGRDGFCQQQPGECFAKNLKWYHEYNTDATSTGQNPPYALNYPPGHYPRYHAGLENADEAVDVSKAGAFQLQRLAFAFPGEHTSDVRIEMNAGLIRWIQSTAPGQITSIAPPAPRECDNAQVFGCPLKVYVLNSGTTDATFYLELPYCTEHGSDAPTEKLDPVPAVQRHVAAGASEAFDLTLRLTAVVDEFDFNCIMKLYDAELNQLDVKTFDLLTGLAQDLPGGVTNPTGEVVVVEPPPDTRNWYQRLMNVVPNDGECDCSFWNLLCLPADWSDCWGTLKRTLKTVLLVAVSVVALVLLWPILKPLMKMACKCLAIPFKCLRSAGKHQSEHSKAKKQRKKAAKKLAKEQKRLEAKAKKNAPRAASEAGEERSSNPTAQGSSGFSSSAGDLSAGDSNKSNNQVQFEMQQQGSASKSSSGGSFAQESGSER